MWGDIKTAKALHALGARLDMRSVYGKNPPIFIAVGYFLTREDSSYITLKQRWDMVKFFENVGVNFNLEVGFVCF